MAEAPEAATERRCADCGAPAPGDWCGACGQETRIDVPTVRHFLRDFIDQYIALEGRMGRTLRALVTQPGLLTNDYLLGRRQRYVRPLKLYLTFSVVFFALLGVLPSSTHGLIALGHGADGEPDAPVVVHLERKKPAAAAAPVPARAARGVDADAMAAEAEAAADDAATIAEAAVAESAPSSSGNTAGKAAGKAAGAKGADVTAELEAGELGERFARRAEQFSKLDPDEQNRRLRKELADDAPYAMFFLLPYFALLLRWLFRREQRLYGVHLLFSVHFHCFMFLVLAVGFLPLPLLLVRALEAVTVIYLYLALRRVYGASRGRTLWRMAWLFAFYAVAVTATAVSGVIGTLLDAGGT